MGSYLNRLNKKDHYFDRQLGVVIQVTTLLGNKPFGKLPIRTIVFSLECFTLLNYQVTQSLYTIQKIMQALSYSQAKHFFIIS